MDFEWAADVLNMDLTGRDPGPRPEWREVPNTDSDMLYRWDERSGAEWEEYPDHKYQGTDVNRQYSVEIHFDAVTELEAILATQAIQGFVRRRLNLDNAVIIGRDNS